MRTSMRKAVRITVWQELGGVDPAHCQPHGDERKRLPSTSYLSILSLSMLVGI